MYDERNVEPAVTSPEEPSQDIPADMEDASEEDAPSEPEPVSTDTANTTDGSRSAPHTLLSVAGCVGGIASLLAAGLWSAEKVKERKTRHEN